MKNYTCKSHTKQHRVGAPKKMNMDSLNCGKTGDEQKRRKKEKERKEAKL